MATSSITSLAGTTAINFFNDLTIQILLFDQTNDPVISPDGLSVTYTFNSDSVTVNSLDGLNLFSLTGTITGFSTPTGSISGLNIKFLDFAIAAGNGDVDDLNALIWGGNDTINGGASNDELRGFGGNDLINGGDGNDKLYGADGVDRLFGGNGEDRLYGDAGKDRLDGGAGNDRLLGGLGDDRIIGGKGVDNVYGGRGADTFIFNKISDVGTYDPSLPISFDIIRDFIHEQGDLIDLKGIDANATMAGNQAFQFIGNAAFTENAPGTVSVEKYSNYIYLVRLNTDNDAATDALFIVVTPSTIAHPDGLAPAAADFIL
ncbi:MAG: calcium-binding protein [Novosphingobium sp.]